MTMHTARPFVSIGQHGKAVFVLLEDRAMFAALAVEAIDHGDQGDKGHVLSKTVHVERGPYIVFQHWIRSPRR